MPKKTKKQKIELVKRVGKVMSTKTRKTLKKSKAEKIAELKTKLRGWQKSGSGLTLRSKPVRSWQRSLNGYGIKVRWITEVNSTLPTLIFSDEEPLEEGE